MILKIFKYPLAIEDEVEIEMPFGAHILAVQMQKETACIWALVNPNSQKVKRRFRVIGTGHPIEVSYDMIMRSMTDRYIGTFQLADGALVFHVFEM